MGDVFMHPLSLLIHHAPSPCERRPPHDEGVREFSMKNWMHGGAFDEL
jgi:hypothetical protein